MTRAALLSIALAAAASSPGRAQPLAIPAPRAGPAATATAERDETARFLERARAATARYRDRRAAISDGYRRLGPDFPFGGEHWISPALVIRGRLVPEEPQALLYVDSGGTAALVGVAYAIPLEPGAPAPDFPGGAAAWHDHWSTIVQESVRPHTAGAHAHAPPGPRLTMLHAWIHAENPEGIFVVENKSLPFRRLGLRAPSPVSPDAARALSLATGGDALVGQVLDAAAGVRGGAPSAAASLLSGPRARARAIALGAPAGEALTPEALERLSRIWRELRHTVRSELGEQAAAALP